MSRDEWVEVAVDEIAKETGAAFLCLVDDDEVWIPKSQVHGADSYFEGDVGVVLEIPRWLAEEKNLLP